MKFSFNLFIAIALGAAPALGMEQSTSKPHDSVHIAKIMLTGAESGFLESVRLSIDRLKRDNRADLIDYQNSTGRTALMQAAVNGHADVVQCLLDANARVDLHDKDGLSASYLAYISKHERIFHTLQQVPVSIHKKHATHGLLSLEQPEDDDDDDEDLIPRTQLTRSGLPPLKPLSKAAKKNKKRREKEKKKQAAEGSASSDIHEPTDALLRVPALMLENLRITRPAPALELTPVDGSDDVRASASTNIPHSPGTLDLHAFNISSSSSSSSSLISLSSRSPVDISCAEGASDEDDEPSSSKQHVEASNPLALAIASKLRSLAQQGVAASSMMSSGDKDEGATSNPPISKKKKTKHAKEKTPQQRLIDFVRDNDVDGFDELLEQCPFSKLPNTIYEAIFGRTTDTRTPFIEKLIVRYGCNDLLSYTIRSRLNLTTTNIVNGIFGDFIPARDISNEHYEAIQNTGSLQRFFLRLLLDHDTDVSRKRHWQEELDNLDRAEQDRKEDRERKTRLAEEEEEKKQHAAARVHYARPHSSRPTVAHSGSSRRHAESTHTPKTKNPSKPKKPTFVRSSVPPQPMPSGPEVRPWGEMPHNSHDGDKEGPGARNLHTAMMSSQAAPTYTSEDADDEGSLQSESTVTDSEQATPSAPSSFPAIAIDGTTINFNHIFTGMKQHDNSHSGLHHDHGRQRTDVAIINDNHPLGLYQARIGDSHSLKTFFPSTWTRDQVFDVIERALKAYRTSGTIKKTVTYATSGVQKVRYRITVTVPCNPDNAAEGLISVVIILSGDGSRVLTCYPKFDVWSVPVKIAKDK